MKKNIYIAVACFALAACQITEIDSPNPGGESYAFQKGQQVTLTVSSGDKTKAVGTLNGVTKGIDFTWETGDKILVKVGDKSAEFSLVGEGGSKVGKFVGEMPAEGNIFDVQYPVTTPDITSQTYSPTAAIPHDMMLATATGCTVGSAFTLQPQYAALRLNLYGYEREITQIAVTNTTASETYTLTFPSACPAVQVGADSEHATSFLLVVPTGTYSFKVSLTSNDITGAVGPTKKYPVSEEVGIKITTNEMSSSKTFKSGVVYSLPATRITTIWAPVNCGYDDSHKYGLLYQWGRKDGQGYNASETAPSIASVFNGTNGVYTGEYPLNANTFYKGGTSGMTYSNDWIKSGSNKFWNKADSPNDATQWGYITPIKGDFDPCPEGWRVPTVFDLRVLFTNYSGVTTKDSQYGRYYSGQTSYSTSVPRVFLHMAGLRNYSSGTANYRDAMGGYWTSSVKDNSGYFFYFDFSTLTMSRTGTLDPRSYGYSVRCVEE